MAVEERIVRSSVNQHLKPGAHVSLIRDDGDIIINGNYSRRYSGSVRVRNQYYPLEPGDRLLGRNLDLTLLPDRDYD